MICMCKEKAAEHYFCKYSVGDGALDVPKSLTGTVLKLETSKASFPAKSALIICESYMKYIDIFVKLGIIIYRAIKIALYKK